MRQVCNPGEKYNKVVDIWGRTNDLVARSMMEGISKETTINKEGDEEEQDLLIPYTCTQIPGQEGLLLRLGSLLE